MSDTLIVGHSIVLTGSFDPGSAQPKVLYAKGLLRDSDMASLEISVMIPNEAIAFAVEWLNFGVERNRMTVGSTLTHPLPEAVRDFVLDVTDEMPGCRVDAFGINLDVHFATSNIEEWHTIGHFLVPKGFWQNLIPNQPGTLSVNVQAGREDGFAGYIRVRVEPSLRIPNGIYVQVNDHFGATPAETAANPTLLLERLERVWPDSMARADKVFNAVRAIPSLVDDHA